MEIVNYPETPENQIAANQPADPSDAAGDRTNFCPLCCTLNHPLSRECVNCGWRKAFCGAEAAAGRELLFSPTGLFVNVRTLQIRWQALKNWLFLIGSHRYADKLK
jgi:hypothetical protein